MAEKNHYPRNNRRRITDSNSNPNYQGYHNAQSVNYGSNYHFVFGRPGNYNVSFEGVRTMYAPADQVNLGQTQFPGTFPNFPNATRFQNPSSNLPGFAYQQFQTHNSQPGPHTPASVPNSQNSSNTIPMSSGMFQHQGNPPNYGQTQQHFAIGNAGPPLHNFQNHPQNSENVNIGRSSSSSSAFVPLSNQSLRRSQHLAMDDDDEDTSTISSQESYHIQRPRVSNASQFGQNFPQYPGQ